MNNKTKGWIAAGLGGALLLGTGGTFAMWKTEGKLTVGTFETGSLSVADQQVTWDDPLLLVPNLTIQGTATVRATVKGPMETQLTVDTEEFAERTSESLGGKVEVTAVLQGSKPESPATVLLPAPTGTDRVTYPVPMTVTVTLLDADGTDLTGQSLDLGDLNVVLEQVTPTKDDAS